MIYNQLVAYVDVSEQYLQPKGKYIIRESSIVPVPSQHVTARQNTLISLVNFHIAISPHLVGLITLSLTTHSFKYHNQHQLLFLCHVSIVLISKGYRV